MSDNRGFGFGSEFIWIIIVIILLCFFCSPGFFGGFGCRE